MSKQHLLFLLAAMILLPMQWSNAQESQIWLRRKRSTTNPYVDVKARRPGDLLVVLINERSDVENLDRRSLNKSGSSDASISGSYSFSPGSTGTGTLSEQTSGSRTFDGNTQFQSEREFLDRFTVSVIDVLPNGNLLIQGHRKVAIEGDQKSLVLTGVVRQVDVSLENTISSQDVAQLDIRYLSTARNGAERKFINQGWLGRAFNKWWP